MQWLWEAPLAPCVPLFWALSRTSQPEPGMPSLLPGGPNRNLPQPPSWSLTYLGLGTGRRGACLEYNIISYPTVTNILVFLTPFSLQAVAMPT